MINEKKIVANLGGRIRALRKECKLTQAQLGEKMDIDESSVRRLELGHFTNPKLNTLLKLCAALEVDMNELLGIV